VVRHRRIEPAETYRAAEVGFIGGNMTARLENGVIATVPLVLFPILALATAKERNGWELRMHGTYITWPDLDEEVWVRWVVQPSNRLPLNLHTLRRRLEQQGRADRRIAQAIRDYRDGMERVQSKYKAGSPLASAASNADFEANGCEVLQTFPVLSGEWDLDESGFVVRTREGRVTAFFASRDHAFEVDQVDIWEMFGRYMTVIEEIVDAVRLLATQRQDPAVDDGQG
jgi:hypothetical protein